MEILLCLLTIAMCCAREHDEGPNRQTLIAIKAELSLRHCKCLGVGNALADC